MKRITELFWLSVCVVIIAFATFIVVGAVAGSLITIFLRWAQQFGNTASAKAIRDEMDKNRDRKDATKKNNPVHS